MQLFKLRERFFVPLNLILSHFGGFCPFTGYNDFQFEKVIKNDEIFIVKFRKIKLTKVQVNEN